MPKAPGLDWPWSPRSHRLTHGHLDIGDSELGGAEMAWFFRHTPNHLCRDPIVTHILLAEDSARIAAFVTKGLRANGYTVTHTADGIEALDLVQTQDFDLLILDIRLRPAWTGSRY